MAFFPHVQVSSTGLLKAIDDWHSAKEAERAAAAAAQAPAAASSSVATAAAPAAAPAAAGTPAVLPALQDTVGKPRLFIVGLAYGAVLPHAQEAPRGGKPPHKWQSWDVSAAPALNPR